MKDMILGNYGDPRLKKSRKHQEEERNTHAKNGAIWTKMNFGDISGHTVYGRHENRKVHICLKGLVLSNDRDLRLKISEKHQERERKMWMKDGKTREKMNFEGHVMSFEAYGIWCIARYENRKSIFI